MGAKGKPVRPTTPIPSPSPVATTALLHHEVASYPAVHHPSASAAPSPAPTPNPMPPPALLHQPSVTRRDAKFITHNDGTLRITVRWSPIEYDALKPTTSNSWVNNATDILHFLLITAPTCFFHTWDPTAPQQTLPMISLNPDKPPFSLYLQRLRKSIRKLHLSLVFESACARADLRAHGSTTKQPRQLCSNIVWT